MARFSRPRATRYFFSTCGMTSSITYRSKVAVLFDCLHADSHLLRALTHFRHPFQSLGSPEREPLLRGHGVKQIQFRTGRSGKHQGVLEGRITAVWCTDCHKNSREIH